MTNAVIDRQIQHSGRTREQSARTILFADLEGYSRRMGSDELGTLDLMSNCFDTLRILTKRFGAELIKTTGDGALLLFDDPANALHFGAEFHSVVERLQDGLANPAKFRIGIHSGYVVLQDGDAFGNAVNIAERIQMEAPPGSCAISRTVYDHVKGETGFSFRPLGAPRLKNINERISLYQIVDSRQSASAGPSNQRLLCTIGQLAIVESGGNVPLPRETLSAGAIGYLALCYDHTETTERLAALLWPDKDRADSKKALRNILQKIMNGFPEPLQGLLVRENEYVRLNSQLVETDLDVLERTIRKGSVPDVLMKDADWNNRILLGLDGFSPLFDSWLQVTRENWRNRILRLLEDLIENCNPASTEARDVADALLLQEPGNEIASAARIRHMISVGNRTGALAEFDRVREHLGKTYGLQPGEEVLSAIHQAREPEQTSISVASAMPAKRRRLLRIAIASFPTRKGNGEDRQTAFRHDLISNLARFRDWSILESAEDEQPQGSSPDLAPDYRIDGKFIGTADDSKLMLTLRDNRLGRVIWRTEVSTATESWFLEQRMIIAKIAATIDVYISADRLSRIMSERDLTSHDSWLRGHQAFMRWTPESAEAAREIFQNIIAVDPEFAPAYSSLASIINVRHIIWPGRFRDQAASQEADRLACHAVDLDPMDSRNQRAVAWSAAMIGAFERASVHLDLCLSLNPNSQANLGSCAMGFSWFGERERAESLVTRLLAISHNLPGWIWGYLASVHFFSGRLEEALKAAELSGRSIVDNQGWTAAILARMGRIEEAGDAFNRLLSDVSRNWVGKQPPKPGDVYEWLSQAYPIRNDSDRSLLSDSLRLALQSA